jgi:threonine dehydrogenase-like Zn-dependent dehydrogenase
VKVPVSACPVAATCRAQEGPSFCSVWGQGAAVPLLIDDLVNGDATVMGSFSYTATAWARVVELLNSGRLDLTFLVTHRYPLAEWVRAVDALRQPVGTRGKVVFTLTGG